MAITKKLVVAVAAIGGLLAGSGVIAPLEGRAQAGPAITITSEGGNYLYSPDQLEAKVGEAITVTNNDTRGVHSVTARDRSFNVDVPPKGSVTLTVSKPGMYPYYCTYHTDTHNAASINVS